MAEHDRELVAALAEVIGLDHWWDCDHYDRSDDGCQADRARAVLDKLVAAGWRSGCAAFAAPLVINGELIGDCDPHTCTKTASHPDQWHACRCGVTFMLAQPEAVAE